MFRARVDSLAMMVGDEFTKLNVPILVFVSSSEHLLYQCLVHVLKLFGTVEGRKFFSVKFVILV